MVEVDLQTSPAEGEVLIFTVGGGFSVKGSLRDVNEKLAAETWATFELSESGDKIIVRSDQVVALRGGNRSKRGTIGLTPH